MTLGDFGLFYECLDQTIKIEIEDSLGFPNPTGRALLLGKMVYALKDLRNAIAHNGVVIDVRFRTGAIAQPLQSLLEQETGAAQVRFQDLNDYLVLLVYLLQATGTSKKRCRQLVSGYEALVNRYTRLLPPAIIQQFAPTTTRRKLASLKGYVKSL